jgi:predicted AAA+ superfamily ATPase
MHQVSESPDRFGLELGFSSMITAVNQNSQITIIKHAHSGTNLYEEWNPGKHEQDTVHWGIQFKEFVKTG